MGSDCVILNQDTCIKWKAIAFNTGDKNDINISGDTRECDTCDYSLRYALAIEF